MPNKEVMGAFEESCEDEGVDVSQTDNSILETLFLNENTSQRLSELERKLARKQCSTITPRPLLHMLYELAQKDYQKILKDKNNNLEQERIVYSNIIEPFAKVLIELSETENATTGYEFIGTLIAHIDASGGKNNTPWIPYSQLILEISEALLSATRTTNTFHLYHAIDTRIPYITDLQGEATEAFQNIQQERSKNLITLQQALPRLIQQLKEQPRRMIQEYQAIDAAGNLPKSARLQKRKD